MQHYGHHKAVKILVHSRRPVTHSDCGMFWLRKFRKEAGEWQCDASDIGMSTT